MYKNVYFLHSLSVILCVYLIQITAMPSLIKYELRIRPVIMNSLKVNTSVATGPYACGVVGVQILCIL